MKVDDDVQDLQIEKDYILAMAMAKELKYAEEARILAEEARILAEQERQIAEEARILAEQERQIAEEAKIIAEKERQIDEEARILAVKEKQDAEKSRVAEEARIVRASVVCKEFGFPSDILQFLFAYVKIFILDNSGSMDNVDGVDQDGIKCTRYEELGILIETLKIFENSVYPTIISFLSGEMFVIGGLNPKNTFAQVMNFYKQRKMHSSTPLCSTLTKACDYVKSLNILANVHIIIATDGESSDGNLVECLYNIIKKINIYAITFKLCTNDPKIVKYYNDIDQELENKNFGGIVETIDDYLSEKQEVHDLNPWLTLLLLIYRLRLIYTCTCLDGLDERLISLRQSLEFIALITTGNVASEIPNPHRDWIAFSQYIKDHHIEESINMVEYSKCFKIKLPFEIHPPSYTEVVKMNDSKAFVKNTKSKENCSCSIM